MEASRVGIKRFRNREDSLWNQELVRQHSKGWKKFSELHNRKAAGGGKSFAALMHHLKYMDLDNYRGLVLRRTTPMLMKPGAIWDEAKALYRDVDPNCQIKIKDLKIIIGPKKAEIAFSHFERVDDTNNFQGLTGGPFKQ